MIYQNRKINIINKATWKYKRYFFLLLKKTDTIVELMMD
jgi:hypothetical protein